MKPCVSGVADQRKATGKLSLAELSQFQHPPLNGGFEKLGGVGDPNLLHHVGPMRLDGLDADFQALGDLLIFESSPDQLQNFLFASRQGFRTSLAGRQQGIRHMRFRSALSSFRGYRHLRLAPLRYRQSQ